MAIEEIFCCVNCGGKEFKIDEEKGCKKCRYCGTEYEDTENTYNCKRIAELIDLDDFKEAKRLCDYYLEKEPKNPTLHWQKFQIKNTIKFVVDPVTKERKPTFRSESFIRDSVLKDENLIKAIEYAGPENKSRYEKWANLIEEIRIEVCDKVISKRDNYDIFISFKATRDVTESNGEKTAVDTRDRMIAREVYEYFTKEGYRVFFSDVVLGKDKRKVGEKYEPTIFGALTSCRAMILIGTKSEYINYGWVKDEWSRYLYFTNITGGIDSRLKKKEGTLFYVFDREVPSGLPDEISSLQGIDYDRRDEFFENLLSAVSAKIGRGSNREGIERIELGKVATKKAKTAKVDSLGTVELGSGNAVKRQQKTIEGNLTVKKFGLDRVAEVTTSTANELNTIEILIKNSRFAPASIKIDGILEEGPNGLAYYYKMLCSANATDSDAFIRNSNNFSDFDLFEKALDCADKETAGIITDTFVKSFEYLLNSLAEEKAIEFFKVLTKYDIEQREDVVSSFKNYIYNTITSMPESGADVKDVIEYIDTYLASIDASDVDNYIAECLEITHTAHANGWPTVAETYIKKVKEIDEENPEVTMFKILLKTGSANPNELIDNLYKIEDLNDIVYLIKNSSSEQASMCMQIFVEGVKRALDDRTIDVNKPLQIFKTLLTFNFEDRDEIKREVFEMFCDNVRKGYSYDKAVMDDFVDYILKATSAEKVDEHIEINKKFAIAMHNIGEFEIAEKFLRKTLELDNADLEARYHLVLTLAKSKKNDISTVVPAFKDENGEVIKATAELLNYAIHDKNATNYSYKNIIIGLTKSIFKALDNKLVSEVDADIAYCNIVRYIQDSEKELLVERLLKMGSYLIENREFALAAKYFKLVLEEEPANFEARWNCVLIELGCTTDFDVIAADKPLETCSQYGDAVKCANSEQVDHICDLASKQEMLIKDKTLASKYDAVVIDVGTTKQIKNELADCPKDDFVSKVEKYYAEVLKREQEEREKRRKEEEAERKRRQEQERQERIERERRRNAAKRAAKEATAKVAAGFFLVFVLLAGGLAALGTHLLFGLQKGDFVEPQTLQSLVLIGTAVVISIISFIAYLKFDSAITKLQLLLYEVLTLIEIVVFAMFICDSLILAVVAAGITISALCVYIKGKKEFGSNCLSIYFVNLFSLLFISATYYSAWPHETIEYMEGTGICFFPIFAILVELSAYILTLVFTAKQVYCNFRGKRAFQNVLALVLYSLQCLLFMNILQEFVFTNGLENSTYENVVNFIDVIPWIVIFGGITIASLSIFLHDINQNEIRIGWLTWLFFTIFETLTIILSTFVLQEYNTTFEHIVSIAGIIIAFVMMNIKNYHDEWKKSIVWLLMPFILMFVVAIFGALGESCSSCSCSSGSCDCGGGGGIIFIILIVLGIIGSKSKK